MNFFGIQGKLDWKHWHLKATNDEKYNLSSCSFLTYNTPTTCIKKRNMQHYTWTQGITLMKKHVEQVNGLDLMCYIVEF